MGNIMKIVQTVISVWTAIKNFRLFVQFLRNIPWKKLKDKFKKKKEDPNEEKPGIDL